MAPFPEAEDMTVKRLYVALKRSDMQLLQMGAHKLHEKFHTGYKFELLDDLKQILSYVEEQTIPNDIKDLLTTTIHNILSGKEPETTVAAEPEYIESPVQEHFTFDEPEQNNETETISNPIMEKSEEIEQITENSTIETKEETFVQDELNKQPLEEEEEEEKPVLFTPEKTLANSEQTPIFNETNTAYYDKKETPIENRSEYTFKKESDLKDVMVFYDDKSPLADMDENISYRNLIETNKIDSNFLELILRLKNAADVQTDETGEILKMLNTIKGKVHFITTSKSENILKTFIENNINFEIPLIQKEEEYKKSVNLIPLFGLSNLFYCPKCHKKEYIANFDNKVLNIQCKNCSSVMYPDIYEANNLNSNSNPYYWIKAISLMKDASTWILINPPLDSNKALIVGLLKTSFEVTKPQKVYILSKETTKREYFKQAFKEINPDCEILSDFTSSNELCEEFINREMSSLQLSV